MYMNGNCGFVGKKWALRFLWETSGLAGVMVSCRLGWLLSARLFFSVYEYAAIHERGVSALVRRLGFHAQVQIPEKEEKIIQKKFSFIPITVKTCERYSDSIQRENVWNFIFQLQPNRDPNDLSAFIYGIMQNMRRVDVRDVTAESAAGKFIASILYYYRLFHNFYHCPHNIRKSKAATSGGISYHF